MEAENGETKTIYLGANHPKTQRSGSAAGTGKTVREVCRSLEIHEQTYYRWRKEYGGINTNQAQKLKTLEKETTRLKNLVAELSLDNAILKEVFPPMKRVALSKK